MLPSRHIPEKFCWRPQQRLAGVMTVAFTGVSQTLAEVDVQSMKAFDTATWGLLTRR